MLWIYGALALAGGAVVLVGERRGGMGWRQALAGAGVVLVGSVAVAPWG